MKFRTTGIGAIIFSIILIVISCNFDGGGSNTGNAKIAGLLVDPVKKSVPYGIVSLYKSDIIPVLPGMGETPVAGRDTSDASGYYYFSAVDTGCFNILCQDSVGSLKALLYNVRVNHRDSLFDTIVLQGTTSLTGTVANPQPPMTVCFVPGSPYIALVNDTSGVFRLISIPWGPYPIIFQNLNTIDTISNCSYTYTLDQLPDTSVVVSVTLICQ
jgi:hypothetical protein